MNYSEYKAYVQDIADYDSAEIYAAEYGCPESCPVPADKIITMFKIIYAVANNDFAAVIEMTASNPSKFAAKFGIPSRTVQQWAKAEHSAPKYVLEMIGFILVKELSDEK